MTELVVRERRQSEKVPWKTEEEGSIAISKSWISGVRVGMTKESWEPQMLGHLGAFS